MHVAQFGTSKTDSYPMAFDDDPSNAYVSIVDTPGFSGMEYMRVEGQDGTVKYVLAPDQPEGGEAPNPKRPMLPRVKVRGVVRMDGCCRCRCHA